MTGISNTSFTYFADKLARTNLIIYFLGIYGQRWRLKVRLLFWAIQSESTRLANILFRYLLASLLLCEDTNHWSLNKCPSFVLVSCSGSNNNLYRNCRDKVSLNQLVPLRAVPTITTCFL